MNQIARCDWLPEQAWDYPPKSFTVQAFSVKMAGYWPPFFCEFMDLDSIWVYKQAKKELGQYPVILTSRLVNNLHLLYGNVNLSVLIGSFLVWILLYGPFPRKRSKPCTFLFQKPAKYPVPSDRRRRR